MGALTFAFALYVREDDLLLWVLLAGLGAALVWWLWRRKTTIGIGLETVIVALALPAAAGAAMGMGVTKSTAFLRSPYRQ